MLGSDDLAFFTIKNVDTTELFAFGGLLLYYCLFAFGESLSFDAQKKVTKEKGRQTPSLRGFCRAGAQQLELLIA
jgi:hypothetical protein